MKKNALILVLITFLAVNLSAQTIPAKPSQSARFVHQPVKSRSLARQSPDSLPFPVLRQRHEKDPADAKKTGPVYRQKMDSLNYQKYDNRSRTLTNLNNDHFAYDSRGRVILSVSYTRDTWDELYHWYKDTLSYDDMGNTTLQIYYTRKLETDPWVNERKKETWYDASSRDTLTINCFKDLWTGEYATSKSVASYDPSNLWIHSTFYILDTATGNWEKNGKMEITMTSEGFLLTYSYFSWSAETQDWLQMVQQEYTYDANGNETSYVEFQLYTDTQTWVGSFREETAYDNKNNPIEYFQFKWESYSGKWIPGIRETNLFDQAGNATETIRYIWNRLDNNWIPQIKRGAAYDDNNNQTLSIGYDWNTETSRWRPWEKYTWVYNANSSLTEYISYVWFINDTAWSPSAKEQYVFNADNKIQLISYFDWDPLTADWIEGARHEREYDSYGNPLQILTLSMKDATGQWTSKNKSEYKYDPSWLDAETITRYDWSDINPYNMLLSCVTYRWNNTTGKWVLYMTQDYYYSEFQGSSGIPESTRPAFRIFPNPAADILFVETGLPDLHAQFEMLDMQGRKVLSRMLTGSHNQVFTGDLANGVYVYKVYIGGEVYQGKLVKD